MTNNIFSSGPKPEEQFAEKVDTHTKTLLSIIQRQKDLESTVDLMNDKIELLDHNSVKNSKASFNDLKSVRNDLKELKEEIANMKELTSKMIKQLKLMSTADEVAKLEKYIDLWNPMEFVTRQELEKYSEDIKKDLTETIEKYLKED